MELRAKILTAVISVVGSVVFFGFLSNGDADEEPNIAGSSFVENLEDVSQPKGDTGFWNAFGQYNNIGEKLGSDGKRNSSKNNSGCLILF